MATITQGTKRTKLSLGLTLAFGSLGLTSVSYAQQTNAGLNVSGSASAEVVAQNVDSDTIDSSLNTFVFTPEINVSYISRRASASLVGSLTHLERESDSASQKQDFGEYSFIGDFEAIENVLNINASRSVSFQNALQNNFLINDFINDQGELVKTTSSSISANLAIANGDLVEGGISAGITSLKTDRNELLDNGGINSDAFISTFNFRQGNDVNRVFWNISGNYTTQDRDLELSQNEFTNQTANATIDFVIAKNLALRINGQNEKNRTTNLLTEFSAARNFSSYGAGLTYFQTDNRFLSVSYNTTDSDIASQDSDNFIGAEVNWAFSARTSVNAAFTRRFFGDSVNASIRYNTKRLRSSLTYTEDVTTNSLLLSTPGLTELFVCPLGSSDFSSCFLPDSLDFVPDAGQEFALVNIQNIELNDGVILRQAGDLQIGYSFSRINLGVFANYAESTFLETNQVRQTATIGFNFGYQLGTYTNLNSRFSYAEIESSQTAVDNDVVDTSQGENDNIIITVDLTHELSKNIDVLAGFSYRDSEGSISNSVFGSNFKDRRFNLSMTYSFN